jgi:cytochrome c oxidase subunit 2
MSVSRPAVVAALAVAVGGCSGDQSALGPQGPGAEFILDLFWLFLTVCTAVFVLVVLGLGYALRRRHPAPTRPLERDGRFERSAARLVAGLVAATAVVLVTLTGASYFTGRSLAGIGDGEPLTIRVTGRQWWWELRYENDDPSRVFTSANEIHVPAGEAVRLVLESSDVIHSFWVPSLAGKLDLVPGRQNTLDIVAGKPGVYRGQCAEFCGLQHAHMAVVVVAMPREEFDHWVDGQLAAAAEPADGTARRGKVAFLASTCVMCHAIRGTPAAARTGPDLTHVGSRRSIAADTLPMEVAAVAAWIRDPQAIKPGANMPPSPLPPGDVEAIASYLAGLK